MDRYEFIWKAIQKHGYKYNYRKVKYVDSKTKICIICPKHGEFWQSPSKHLIRQGCPMCKDDKLRYYNNKVKSDCSNNFIEKAQIVHEKEYDYSKVNYIDSKTNVCIICKKHGEFYTTPNAHLRGNKCPKCSLEIKNKNLSDDRYKFIWKAVQKHGYKYDYSKVSYVRSKSDVEIICRKHGSFWQRPNNHLSGSICPTCAKENIGLISKYESEIYDFIAENYTNTIIRNDRNIIKPNELDLYLPDINIAFEFDGLYWHNELNKPKDYHLNKTKSCNELNIKLIHIFEDEWIYKKDIVKSRILNIINKTNIKIYARKCDIRNVSYIDSKDFLKNNHLQGNCSSSIRYGLYYNNKLVSLMTFGKLRRNVNNKYKERCFEMIRFVNERNHNIIGGASKLLKHFIKTIKPKEIISYSDNRWGDGNLYLKLGFKFVRNSEINYFYVINNKKYNRLNFKKDALVKQGFDKNKSEHEIMLDRHIYRIYDCGCKVFLYKNQ